MTATQTGEVMQFSSTDLLEALRRRHIKRKAADGYEGGLFLEEVTHSGAGGARADALFVGFTSTTGRQLVGYEIKVTRADWLRELEQPLKAGWWADQCHEWWLAAANDLIVEPGELPPGWGLITPKGVRAGKLQLKIVEPALRRPLTWCPSWQTTVSVISRCDSAVRSKAWQDRERIRTEERERAEQHVVATSDVEKWRVRARAAEGQLDAIKGALELSNYDDVSRYLPQLRAFCRSGYDVQRAGEHLRDGYGIADVRRALEQLDAALAKLPKSERGT